MQFIYLFSLTVLTELLLFAFNSHHYISLFFNVKHIYLLLDEECAL